jgi:hypothetical protein
VRVAILTLLTLTMLSGYRSCGVVMAKFSGQTVTLRRADQSAGNRPRFLSTIPAISFKVCNDSADSVQSGRWPSRGETCWIIR